MITSKNEESQVFAPVANRLRSDDPESVMRGFEQMFCAIQQGRLIPASDLAFRLFDQLVGIDWTHMLDMEGLELASDYYTGNLINTAESLEGIARMLRDAASSSTSHEKIKSQLEAEVWAWPLLAGYGFLHRNLEVAARYYRPTDSFVRGYRHLLDQLADEIEHSQAI